MNTTFDPSKEEYLRSVLRHYANDLSESRTPFAKQVWDLSQSPTVLTDPPLDTPEPNLAFSIDGTTDFEALGGDTELGVVGVDMAIVKLITNRDFHGLLAVNGDSKTLQGANGVKYHLNDYGTIRSLPVGM